MAYPYTREDYDDEKPLYAVRSFVTGGVEFQPSDLFDRKKLDVPLHAAHVLFRTRYIDHHRMAQSVAAPAVQPVTVQPVSPGTDSPRHKRQGARP